MFSEQDIDRELRAALSASPSPDFEARVLRRVDADRLPRWRAQYGWLAAAASVVVVAGAFYSMNRTPIMVVPQPSAGMLAPTAPEPPATRQEDLPASNTAEPPRVTTARAPRMESRTAPRLAEPEVIVPVNQMEAVRRLVREVNAGRRIEPPADPLGGPMAPPPALGIPPVTVEPIRLAPLVPDGETAAPFIGGVK